MGEEFGNDMCPLQGDRKSITPRCLYVRLENRFQI